MDEMQKTERREARVNKTVTKFDTLPDSAHVPLPVVAALCSIGMATLYRHVKAGILPRPVKLGGRSAMPVGELRRSLAAAAKARG